MQLEQGKGTTDLQSLCLVKNKEKLRDRQKDLVLKISKKIWS